MDLIKTSWPEVNAHLETKLVEDPYIQWHLRQGHKAPQSFPYKPILYVSSQAQARNIMKINESPRGLEVWLEVQDEDARPLLRSLPAGKELFVSVGTPLGLEMVQEELTGLVRVLQLFCIVDRDRFRTVSIHPVSRLGPEDWQALKRYPASSNRDFYFRAFEEGKVVLYGSYKEQEIVGYAAPFADDTVGWVHVRPEFRGQGYGKSLLSRCTMGLLQKQERVFYSACMEDIANARICMAVGFVPLRETFFFQGKRDNG